MNIMISGGLGYIGSTVTETLCDIYKTGICNNNNNVIVVDNLCNSKKEWADDRSKLYIEDACNEYSIYKILIDNDIDIVIHLAAIAVIDDSLSDEMYRVNHIGTRNLLYAMEKAHVRKLIFSSTAAVYGDHLERPYKETDIMYPCNEYGNSKLYAEREVENWANRSNSSYIIFRYFNAAGATKKNGERHNPETHIIPKALDSLYGGQKFVLNGSTYPTKDGTCIRDYVHVKDIAEAHFKCVHHLLRESPFGGTINEIINIGNNQGYSNLEVLKEIENITGNSIDIELGKARREDPPYLVADNTKLRRLLKLNPRPLKECLVDAINFRNDNN